MAKFLTGEDLNNLIYDIIWNAESKLLIVSPYIKLGDYFKELFDKHKSNPNVNILLVFGKNEKSVNKSFNKSDFEYFKEFPNISIVYVPNLHAKYYANENHGVITSINLYDYSFKNNIEFGVFSEQSILGRFSNSTNVDIAAWDISVKIAAANEVVYIKRPIFETKKGLLTKSKNYMQSEVLFDSTEKFYGIFKSKITSEKSVFDYPDEIEFGQKFDSRPQRNAEDEITKGYCIRTGVSIKYNPSQPMSRDSWKKWNEFANENYPEKYCHKTGNPSNGKTSMKNPFL